MGHRGQDRYGRDSGTLCQGRRRIDRMEPVRPAPRRGPLSPGDQPDVLVAMNPAALKGHLGDLAPHGVIIANANAFNDKNLKLAEYDSNPLEDGSLEDQYEVHAINMTDLVTEACKNIDISEI